MCVCGGRGPSSLSESWTVKVSPPWWRGSSFTGGQQLPGFQQLVPGTPHKLVVRGLGDVCRKGWKPQELQQRSEVEVRVWKVTRCTFSFLCFSSLSRIHTTHTHCANVKESCFTVSVLMHFYVLFKVLLTQTILKYMSYFLLCL